MVERFNRQLHLAEVKAVNELAQGNHVKQERFLAASCRQVNCTAQESLNSAERARAETLMARYPDTAEEEGILTRYWIQKEKQRFGHYPAFAGVEQIQLFTYTETDKLSDSQLFAKNQWVENASNITGWSKGTIEALGLSISLAGVVQGKGGAAKAMTPTSNWGDFLRTEKVIQQSAVMKQQIIDIRASLPSGLKREGNVAVAHVNIDGLPLRVSAHSRIDTPTLSQVAQGIVGKSSGIFSTQTLPSKTGAMIPRATDSEAKILDSIAKQLGNKTTTTGTVNIFTERPACVSCLGVVEQFKAKYPNIQVNVLDNNGVVLRPLRKN